MIISEEDVKPFVRFWQENFIKSLDEQTTQMMEVMKNSFRDIPRDADGEIRDDYFRGSLDALEGFVKGLRFGLDQGLAEFDKRFEYQWYRYQKTLKETPA